VSLSPRAIAMQGLGSSTRLVAVQGLWPAGAAFTGAGISRSQRASVPLTYARARLIGDEDEILLAMTLSAWGGVLQ